MSIENTERRMKKEKQRIKSQLALIQKAPKIINAKYHEYVVLKKVLEDKKKDEEYQTSLKQLASQGRVEQFKQEQQARELKRKIEDRRMEVFKIDSEKIATISEKEWKQVVKESGSSKPLTYKQASKVLAIEAKQTGDFSKLSITDDEEGEDLDEEGDDYEKDSDGDYKN